ncbi:MAG: dynamin family protein [Bacteroidota bacterium]
MASNLLSQNIQTLRAQVDEMVKDLHELTIQIKNDDLAKTVSDLRNRIHEPFMFVIVGEVKAGKSSFVNALLDAGKEITKAAPQPMTDTIQQIIYGEEEEIIEINPFLKKILLPIDILQEIAIVDTPGTNTIIEHHQEITESFIPASDLIVFVFEAKNPYRQSAWDFFNFIHQDWQRKTIFVLQQKDLMKPEDLEVNRQGVIEYAQKKGIAEPQVFAVSAMQELEGPKEESGYEPLRDYIKANITGGQAPVLKLQNNVQTSLMISQRIKDGLDLRRKQFDADVAFRKDITETLDHQENKSYKQVDLLTENLVAGYDRITNQKEDELRSGLSFFALIRRSFSAIFSKKTSLKEWLEGLAKELEAQLNTELKAKLNDGVVDLADSIQQMAKLIDLKIRNSETILRNDHDVFSDIAERRNGVLRELQETFSSFLQKTENFADASLFGDKQSVSPNLATGSGIAVIGVIIATVTNGIAFDITGGILTAIGLVFAGVSTRVHRRKIMEGFQVEVANGRLQLEEEVRANLKTYISNLKKRIDQNFQKLDNLLEEEKEQLGKIEQKHQTINNQLVQVQEAVEVKLPQ